MMINMSTFVQMLSRSGCQELSPLLHTTAHALVFFLPLVLLDIELRKLQ